MKMWGGYRRDDGSWRDEHRLAGLNAAGQLPSRHIHASIVRAIVFVMAFDDSIGVGAETASDDGVTTEFIFEVRASQILISIPLHRDDYFTIASIGVTLPRLISAR